MIKSIFPLGHKYWHIIEEIDIFLAKLRGFYYKIVGVANGNRFTTELLIGPTSRSFFETGASIILCPTVGLIPANKPVDFNLNKYALGLLNPRRYQNPGSGCSRFRLCEFSRLELELYSRVGPGFYFSIAKSCTVRIQSWTYIGSSAQFHCRSGIFIGQRCMISHNLTLMDYDGHPIQNKDHTSVDCDFLDMNAGNSGDIVIGDDVWIGANCTILKCVKIGNGSVIASNSVVTKSVPPRCLAAGNPAKIIKEEIKWSPF